MVTEFPWEVLFHSLWLSDHGICKFLCEDCIFIQSYAWTHMHTHVHTHTFRWTHSHSYPYSHIDTHTDSYCHTIALISHANKVILKIPQARLQQYVNCERSDVQAGFRKGRGNRDQVANVRWIIEKAREFQKNIYFCFTDYAKALDCVDHDELWKILQEMEIPDHQTCLLRNPYAGQEVTVRTGHGKTESPNRERNTSRLYIVTLLIQLLCRVHHEKCWTEWSTSWNQYFQEKYQ